jgi:hypothetical protein
MRELKKTTMDNKREKEQRKLRLEQDLMQGLHGDDEVINIASDDEEHVRMEIRKSLRDKNLSHAIERRGGGEKAVRVSVGKRSVTAYFDKDLASSKAPVQPRIDTALSKGSREQIGQAWSKWFQANDIAGIKADCPYFRNAYKLMQQLGPGGYIPTGHAIDGEFLQANFEEAEQSLEKSRQGWDQYGVTIMCDSWTGPTGMAIINFMVSCNGRMFFHKSIDASNCKQSAGKCSCTKCNCHLYIFFHYATVSDISNYFIPLC